MSASASPRQAFEARAAELLQALARGRCDFVESGDCRHPGQHGALRAAKLGDAFIVYPADKDPSAQDPRLDLPSAASALAERAAELSGSSSQPRAVMPFSLHLRKGSPMEPSDLDH